MMNRLCIFFAAIFLILKADAQVNLQTGSATFSLPMFSWQDDKSRLNSMVALSYNSGNGLRVSEIASNAGQGWNLIAGGEIVRMQAGEPDDQVKGDGNGTDYDITKYPSGILYATIPAANGCPNALTKYPIYGWKNQLYAQHNVIAEDKQLDYFSFQFNGKAGIFVLDPTNIGVCHSLGDTKMKITFLRDDNLVNQGIRTRITSFTIQDVDGLIYKFTKHGLTKVLRTEFCDEDFNYKQTQPKFKNGKVYYQSGFDNTGVVNPWIIGSWSLTEVEDPLTQRKIFFNYTSPRNINTVAGYDISTNFTNKDYGIVSRKMSITQSPEISSVVYPDGHIVNINYGAARADMNGLYAISSVDITYQGRYLSQYQLNTSYFILNRYGTPVTDYQKKVARLCLLSVKKIGVDLKEDTPPYIFDYYTGSNTNDDYVPPPFTYAKDIWGFYNGENSKGYNEEPIILSTPINRLKNFNQLRGLCYMRDGVAGVHLNAKPKYARNGLLKQIIYPTGGTLTYEYEQNVGIMPSVGNINVGGVHVAKTSSTDGGYSNGCANPISTSYNYVVNGVGSASSLWGLEMPKNSMVSHNHYQPEYKSYRWTPGSIFGECYWHFQYPGIMSQQQSINSWMDSKAGATLSVVMNIVSILGTIQDVALFIGGGSPVSLIIDVIVGLAQVGITCIGDQAKDNTATIYFNSDLNSAAPLPIQFKRVEVIENPGTIGRTVQEFTSSDDYAIWEPTNPIYSAKQRFASWAYGLPKRTIVYDANGNKVKETENQYDFTYAKNIINSCGHPGSPCNSSGLNTNLVSCKCEVTNSYSQRNTKWTDFATYNPEYLTASNGDMKVDFYGMYTGRTELINTSEKIFKTGSTTQYVESSTKYTYNLTNYELNSVTTVQSNGDKSSKYFTFSCDYFGGIFDILNQENIISIPVSTTTLLIPSTSPAYNYTIDNNNYYFSLDALNNWYVMSEKVTEFVNTPDGDIKPTRIIEQRFDKPKSGGFISGVGWSYLRYPGPDFADYSKYKILQTFTYNSSGNLTGIKDEGGRTITNIYDYNDKYAVATVINADPLVDKTAYTSFETTDFGGWTLSGAPAYMTSNAITGTSSFTLSAGKSLSAAALNTTRPYTVSFWATTAGIIVTGGGATLTKSAPTINGFTYYEYKISQETTSVTISGNGTIDELRLLPKTARMRTTTYDPLIGKTSECDDNGRITYYEYDDLGRLRFVKDEYKNIVKMHEYNNVSAAKQRGCPGTYTNRLISEIFTKSNCGPGFIGSDVVFNVSADTYTSTISQADADAQAEHYLLANGQAYANANGTCQTIYYNAVISRTDTTENCPEGYVGGLVTYTVPASRYTSLISPADADEKALDDLEANADAYINDPAHAVCVFNTEPVWTWLENAASYCQYVNGENHLFIQETNTNPNSSTYLQTRWSDVGPDSERCPPSVCNDCTGEGYACINNVCEQGVMVNTYTTSIGTGEWICIYHYEFSDGSWSQDYEDTHPSPCVL